MTLLCSLGIHRAAWIPDGIDPLLGMVWIRVRRCARCGMPLPR